MAEETSLERSLKSTLLDDADADAGSANARTDPPREKLRRRRDRIHEAERLLAFTDAVVAIAMTLLVLPLMEAASDVGAAEGPADVADYFSANGNKFWALAVSFFLAGTSWKMHDALFQPVGRFTGVLLSLNFLWLFGHTLLPVSASLLYQAPGGDNLGDVAFVANYLWNSTSNLLMCLAIRRDGRTLKDGRDPPGKLVVSAHVIHSALLVVALAIAVSLSNKNHGVCLFALLPTPLLERFVKRQRPEWTY